MAEVYLSLIREPALGARGRGFFSAFGTDHGAELWVSDGTSDGTGPLEHLLPGNLALSPAEFTREGGRIFFSAMNADFDRDLWLLDLPPGITIEDASAREANRSTPAVFRVRLSHPSSDPVTVQFETEGGTAEPLHDFAPASGALRFAPGEVVKVVRVQILADAWAEGPEEFTVRLTNPANAELDRDHAVGTIRDPAPRLAGSRPLRGRDAGFRPLHAPFPRASPHRPAGAWRIVRARRQQGAAECSSRRRGSAECC